jgi:hypothetical protein
MKSSAHSSLYFSAAFIPLLAAGLLLPAWLSAQLSAHSTTAETGAIKPIDVNMHDFMEGVYQAPYKRLKVAMAKEPADNAAWKAIRSDALILAEGGNLLLARLPEENKADWIKHSELARDAGGEFVATAKKKDFAAAKAAYEKMLIHCNDCHKQFEQGKHILTP